MRETCHGRSGATVDFYRTVTGRPRVDSVEDPKRPGEQVRVVRLTDVIEVISCAACWSKPEVRAALKSARETGVLPGA